MRPRDLCWLLALVLLAADVSQAGQVIDVRRCPLNTITFIDPWADGEFQVTRVGTDDQYLCESGWTARPPAGEQCQGPYGDLILEGTLRAYEGSEPETVFAVWHRIKGVLCCGWSVFDRERGLASTRNEGFRWLEDEHMPLLKDFGFASIDFDPPYQEGASIFGNPKYAMRCELTD